MSIIKRYRNIENNTIVEATNVTYDIVDGVVVYSIKSGGIPICVPKHLITDNQADQYREIAWWMEIGSQIKTVTQFDYIVHTPSEIIVMDCNNFYNTYEEVFENGEKN